MQRYFNFGGGHITGNDRVQKLYYLSRVVDFKTGKTEVVTTVLNDLDLHLIAKVFLTLKWIEIWEMTEFYLLLSIVVDLNTEKTVVITTVLNALELHLSCQGIFNFGGGQITGNNIILVLIKFSC